MELCVCVCVCVHAVTRERTLQFKTWPVLVVVTESTRVKSACTCVQDSLFSGLVNKYQEQITSPTVHPEHSGKLAALAIILANVFTACPQDKVVLVSNHTKVSSSRPHTLHTQSQIRQQTGVIGSKHIQLSFLPFMCQHHYFELDWICTNASLQLWAIIKNGQNCT